LVNINDIKFKKKIWYSSMLNKNKIYKKKMKRKKMNVEKGDEYEWRRIILEEAYQD